MNPDIKRRWVESLRSGKYQQGEGCLQSDHGYCCLGVLCDLYSQETGEKWKSRGDVLSFHGEMYMPPEEVKDWADLRNVPLALYSSLNDSGKSFNEISYLIEEQL